MYAAVAVLIRIANFQCTHKMKKENTVNYETTRSKRKIGKNRTLQR